MSYFYLIIAVISTSLGSVFCEFYNRKTVGYKNATQLFNFVRLCSTLVVWGIIYACDFSFEWGVLWYSLGFGLCFALVNVCIIYAFQYGSVALTSLILQTSLIGVTIWGLIFWKAPVTTLVVVGLILVLISLALCIFEKKNTDKSTKKLSHRVPDTGFGDVSGNIGKAPCDFWHWQACQMHSRPTPWRNNRKCNRQSSLWLCDRLYRPMAWLIPFSLL